VCVRMCVYVCVRARECVCAFMCAHASAHVVQLLLQKSPPGGSQHYHLKASLT
jgi:hypothetical protein